MTQNKIDRIQVMAIVLHMNEPVKIVGYSWVERGGRGYVQLNIFSGKPEDCASHTFYLAEAEALSLGYELEAAVKRGLGQPPKDVDVQTATDEQLMERTIALCFSTQHVHLDRPRECLAISRQGTEVQIVSATGQRAFLSCASKDAAIRVQEALQLNNLSDVRLSPDLVKMVVHAGGNAVHAAGVSEAEIEEFNRDYKQVAEDYWSKDPDDSSVTSTTADQPDSATN